MGIQVAWIGIVVGLWVVLLGSAPAAIDGHGMMTSPEPRVPTATYDRDCYAGLKGAGKEERQLAPVENLIQRKQSDQPSPPTFDVMNGCRGMIYETEQKVTELTAGQPVEVKWLIQAPHPGYMELSIVKPKTAEGGKIMYESTDKLYRDDKFAETGGSGSHSVVIPATVTGCDAPGKCALQFLWHSELAKQTYPTCADIVIKGGGGTGPAPAPPTSGAATNATAPPPTSAGSPPGGAGGGGDSKPKKECKRQRRS